MKPDDVIEAVLELWAQLPGLLGPAWPQMRATIRALVENPTLATSDDLTDLSAELLLAFDRFPAARAPFRKALGRIVGELDTTRRGSTPHAEAAAHRVPWTQVLVARLRRLAGRRPATLTRDADIGCPPSVSMLAPRIGVFVRLRVPPAEAGEATDVVLAPAGPVKVSIDAAHFEVIGEKTRLVTILSDADSPPVVFDLRPRRTGETRINLDFYAGTQPAGSASVRVTVTAGPDAIEGAAGNDGPPAPVPIRLNGDAPDRSLTIAHETDEKGHRLVFTLREPGTNYERVFAPVELGMAPQERARQLFGDLAALTANIDPVAHADLGRRVPLGPAEVTRTVKQIGMSLWRDLVPADLRAVYGTGEGWKDRTLYILSDEPLFPWELVWPHGPLEGPGEYWEDDEPWCMALRLSRWLRRRPNGEGNEAPPPRLPIAAIAGIVPSDSGLPSAGDELAMLAALARENEWLDLTPDVPTLTAVRDLLERGGWDWLYAAAHGSTRASGAGESIALWLQGLASIGPDAIVGVVAHRIRLNRPSFFFNACHAGRLGWSLGRLDGWARALVGSGAGAFLAPLWPVTDDLALQFAKAFYKAFLEGKPIAEAVREGRRAARREGDPTWLAYSLYADPNARYEPPYDDEVAGGSGRAADAHAPYAANAAQANGSDSNGAPPGPPDSPIV